MCKPIHHLLKHMKTLSTNKSITLLPKFLLITAILLFLGFILKQAFEAHKIYDIAKLVKHTTEIISESIDTKNQKTETKAKEREVHGNSDKNCDMHLVYEIFREDSLGIQITLKYGVTSQNNFKIKYGNPRPKYQVNKFQKYEKYKNYHIDYVVLDSMICGRIEAKKIEQELVNIYFTKYRKMPPEQHLPTPN